MKRLANLSVAVKWVENKGLLIYGMQSHGGILPVSVWKHLLFQWHVPSYYGTLLQSSRVGQIEGILLTPIEALTFFKEHHENSLVEVTYLDEAKEFHQIISHLYPSFHEGQVSPSFAHYQAGNELWRIDGTELLEPTVQELVSAAIKQQFEIGSIHSKKWEIARGLYHNPTYLKQQLTHSIDEDDWHVKIGLRDDDVPFSIRLVLEEPMSEHDDWHLRTYLIDERKAIKPYEYSGHPSLHSKHASYAEYLDRTFQGVGLLVPTLIEDNQPRSILSEQNAWTFLTEDSEKVLSANIQVLLPSWWQALKQNKMTLKASVKGKPTGNSFFNMETLVDFNWRISTNGMELSEQQFQQFVENQRRLIQFNGQWIALDPAFIARMKKMMEKAEKQGLRFHEVLQHELLQGSEKVEDDNSPFAEVEIEVDDVFRELTKRLTSINDVPDLEKPAGLQATLRAYQQKGFEWLIHLKNMGFGALLADDMGLGKTIQSIAYLAYRKEHEEQRGASLIVCPTSVINNWKREIETFYPGLTIHVHYGGNRLKGSDLLSIVRDVDIIITSYALSVLDYEDLKQYAWKSIILDEAQNIKNPSTKQSRAVRGLKAEHRIALTGTPMENRLTELWTIFDFINRGYLGTLNRFVGNYVNPIEKDRDEEKISAVHRLIAPFLLRRTKQDEDVALNLPPKQEQKMLCPLSVEQAALYEQVVQDSLKQIDTLSGIERRGRILWMLNKLKQICDHPSLFLKESQLVEFEDRSSKVERLFELIDPILEQNESCLIFTQYVRMGDMLKEAIQSKFGEEVLFLNGSVPKTARDQMINRFQNGEVKIFILSLKAGGTGLNLTAANHVMHFDRWWNPAVENQATDRAYRIGQTKFVQVHKFVTIGTLEEKIDEMLQRKQSLNDTIITSEQWITELSMDELADLLGV
ncbi:DEAD/DEAH box helicase [Gottfriedia solisilvae]|uniref:ATP-dependent helicase n=1 Tax=Gottfriedia solisilvae TaxID=1516104 RepID=A0A8J3AN81_9BACI|nr:DEAD/DEAH box helicase [Gottfriedia solisilvae]GGI16724.1 ATP-dependent helicase [Gottfriedia solisilvae]